MAAPGAPTGLTATAKSAGRIDLAWVIPASDGGSPITGYKIERETPVAGGFVDRIATTGSQSVKYYDTACLVETQYNYRVSAINVDGTSVASAAANATTSATVFLSGARAKRHLE